MAATFTLKLGTLDLSSYVRVNPDDAMDPYGQPWVEPTFTETPFSDGQPLISTTVHNREQQWPMFLRDPTLLKDQLHALIRSINNAAAQRPLLLQWKDDGASQTTWFDVAFVRFEPNFNFRRSQKGYAAGVLHVWTSGYGHTGTTRITATAAGTGVFLSVPIASVAGDAPALMVTSITDGGVVPSLGRIVAVAPISNPSYTPQILAASLTDLQPGASLVGASGADASQYLALPVSPTGGASGVACKVPLPNPTIAGGDNRILAVVKSGIDAGVGITALDPYGNLLGATAVASMSQSWGLVDLGVCRLPTVGYPTLPKLSILAGALWASGGIGPNILASPAGLAINEILCLPDKNLCLLFESGAGRGSVISKAAFGAVGALPGLNDDLGNPWTPGLNNANSLGVGGFGTGYNVYSAQGYVTAQAPMIASLVFDADRLGGVISDSMLIQAKPYFASPGLGHEEIRLFKDVKASQYVQARLAASRFLSLEAATGAGGQAGNVLASVQIATFSAGQKYRLALQLQGPGAFINLSRDDGGPVFAPGSMAQASIGVASNAAVAGAGAPALAIGYPSYGNGAFIWTRVYSWEVDTIPSSSLLPYDTYTIDGVTADSYRVASGGAFAGAKLVSQQHGAFPKMQPSTTSVAVVAAAYDQGPANDIISAAISVRERFFMAV